MVDQRVLFPHLLAGRSIDRDQPSVVGGDEHLALVDSDATIDDVAAALVAQLAVDAWIIGPDFPAVTCVDRVHHAPRPGLVHDAVDHDRRRLDAALGTEAIAPHRSELFDVV